jgi:phosphoglycolate phosphatase
MKKISFSSRSVKCILWDLDGTLVSTGGAGMRALDRAFRDIHGVMDAMKDVNPAGKTDPAIIREIFHQALNRDCSAQEMKAVQDKYLDYLPAECSAAQDYHVLPGIPEILERLSALRMVCGLGTGNLERGARIKLDRAGLNRHLPFGGFGSDSESRAALLKTARVKAEACAGLAFESDQVFVVGDTERDILAAREAGFKVVAVATGHSPVEHLSRFQPDYLLPDFSRTQDFLEIVCGS